MHDTEAPTMTQAEQDAAAWRSTAGRYLSALEVAERQRDEVGIQLVAAQAEIARMRSTLAEVRTCVRHSSTNSLRDDLIVALAVLDIVSGDTLVRP